MNSIKVIGFDLDQTLYPKSPEIDRAIQIYLYHKIKDHLNVSIEEAERLFTDLYQNGNGISGSKTLEKLGVPDADNSVQEALEKADILKFLKPNNAVISLLKKIKEKYQNVDLITGSNLKITLGKLKHLNIDSKLFNHLITNDDGSKSNGDTYRLWLSKYPSFPPSDFCYIGDRSKTDYFIPNSLGIQSILVNQKQQKKEILCPQLPSLLDVETILL